MRRKYEQVDAQLLAWLHRNRKDVTTALAIEALGTECPTTQRHISRRFSQLEDRGVLKCDLRGTTRVCTVEKDPPNTLAKQRWRPKAPPTVAPLPSIPAEDSTQFEAGGGHIERLPTQWDKPAPVRGLGALTFIDFLNSLD